MPYRWKESSDPATRQMLLWPHQSLTAPGFAGFIGVTFGFLLLPLLPLLGTQLLWGLLPFLMAALAGVWVAISRNQKRAQVTEVLTLSQQKAHLMRRNPGGEVLEWDCNRYWACPELHIQGGPVPHYVTLKGAGREVEIGAFLSEEERKTLYDELASALPKR